MTTEIVTVKGDNGVEFPCTKKHYEYYKSNLTLVAETPEKLVPVIKEKPAAPVKKRKRLYTKKKKVTKDN